MRAVSDVTAVRVTVPSSCVTSVYVTLPRGITVPLASGILFSNTGINKYENSHNAKLFL